MSAVIYSSQNPQLQSPYLYVQAVGSLGKKPDRPLRGEDGSTRGVQLRWDLTRNLGEYHIPRGELGANRPGYDKPEDFVHLYKAVYKRVPLIIDFESGSEGGLSDVVSSGANRYWRYSIAANPSLPAVRSNVIIRFKDINRYDQLAGSIDPWLESKKFMALYRSLFEIQVEGKLCYEVVFKVWGIGHVYTDVVALPADQRPENRYIFAQKLIKYDDNKIGYCEHIEYIRCEGSPDLEFQQIELVTYDDTMLAQDWKEILEPVSNKPFGLTLNSSLANSRLAVNGTVHRQWPRYNDTNSLGHNTVNVQNYLHRWNLNTPDEIGIRKGIQDFLTLSSTDPKAYKIEDDDQGVSSTGFSYLDLLKIISMDYHVARMLGLGYIDQNVNEKEEFIYLTKYKTNRHPDDYSVPEVQTHFSMSLPSNPTMQRYPGLPRLEPNVTYGLTVDNGTQSGSNITDEDGYPLFSSEQVRYVNLIRLPFQEELGYRPFLEFSPDFSVCEHTYPVQYGIEYNKSSEPGWVNPEILHTKPELDDDGNPVGYVYKDGANYYEEVLAVPNNGDFTRPLFTHKETNEGKHKYSIYAINWFSRASQLSNVIQTDETIFPKRNRLLPPASLAVQLIQPEDQLLLTTQTEQDMLAAAGGAALIRVMFEWNQVQNLQYEYGQEIEFFWKEEAPLVLQGTASSGSTSNGNLITVTLDNPIPSGQNDRFVGSVLVANEKSFYVEEVTNSTQVRVRPLRNTVVQDPNNTGEMFVTENFETPEGFYVLVENMSNPDNWPNSYMPKFSLTTPEGVAVSNPVFNQVEPDEPKVFSITIPGSPSPDWFRGTVLIPFGADNNVELKVWSILEDSGSTKLIVFDPDEILTGPTPTLSELTFYPGYKVYLNSQGAMNNANILPAAGEGQKITFIGARALDGACTSLVTTPAPMMAMEIITPVEPGEPVGPTFATRPDFYGKATYTFDVAVDNVGREPYGLVFYRADAQKILNTLYQSSTVEAILNDPLNLPGIGNNDFNPRWQAFVNNLDFSHFGFPDNANYEIPVPDYNIERQNPFDGTYSNIGQSMSVRSHYKNGNLVSENRTLEVIIREAMENAFLALNEIPVLYKYLADGDATGLITSSLPAVVADADGQPLDPADPAFKPYPMALKHDGGSKVRFTDYTLDGASLSFYFFFAVELGPKLNFSDRSAIVGPIQLVNAFPPDTVAIKKVTTQLANPILSQAAAVKFEINPYVETEHIRQFHIYRATDQVDALSVRTMTLAKVVQEGEELLDDFDDLNFPPYGDPIYYRVVALREIINEDDVPEFIPSKPSNTALASIVDNVNPAAPILSFTSTSNTGGELQGVNITWDKTTHNGTYYLYKMNNFGTWVKIYDLSTNDDTVTVDLADTTLGNNTLDKENDSGDPIYHHFKVQAENASGLLSLTEEILTI